MKSVLPAGVLLLILALSLPGCSPAPTAPQEIQLVIADAPRQTTPVAGPGGLRAVAGGNNAFAFDLYQHLASEQDGNFVFSPYSISLAFAMTYAGARGETETQMAEIFHYALPQDQLHPALNALDMHLNQLGAQDETDDFTLNIINSVWGQEGYMFQPEYLTLLAQNYGAGLRLLDFEDGAESARAAINQWASEETEGRIPEPVPEGIIDASTRLVLVNAVYLKAHWLFPFYEESTRDAAFHLLDGSEVDVPLMFSASSYQGCAQGNGFLAIESSYELADPDGTAMLFIVPDEGQFETVERSLDADSFGQVVGQLEQTGLLGFNLPRFEFESVMPVGEVLPAMGLTAPFGAEADFSGISGDGLFIDAVLHQAVISVDEWGTEAAAVTVEPMAEEPLGEGGKCPDRITVDRPFTFAIYERRYHTLLFLGRVMDPSAH